MKEVLDFVLKEPSEDNHIKGHVLPWKCAEIICSDISKITDLFFTFEYFEKTSENSNTNNIEIDNHNKQNKLEEDNDRIITHKNRSKRGEEAEKKNPSDEDSFDSGISMDSKEIVPDKRKKRNIELLDHIFKFLEAENDLNYVLVGYFMKILNYLNMKNNKIVRLF